MKANNSSSAKLLISMAILTVCGSQQVLAQQATNTSDLWARQRRLEQTHQRMEYVDAARQAAVMRQRQQQLGSGMSQTGFRRLLYPGARSASVGQEQVPVALPATAAQKVKANKTGKTAGTAAKSGPKAATAAAVKLPAKATPAKSQSPSATPTGK